MPAQTDKLLAAYFVYLQKIQNTEHLIRFLAEPLDALHIQSKPDYPKWHGSPLPDNFIESTVWQKHLQFLLRHVVVDWSPTLTVRQKRDLIHTTFSPAQEQDDDDHKSLLKQRMSVVALQVLVGELAAAASSSSRETTEKEIYHSLLISTILSLLRKLLGAYSVSDFYQAALGHDITMDVSRRQSWKTFVNTLCSVPVRVANIVGVSRDYIGNGWEQETDDGVDGRKNEARDNVVDMFGDLFFFSKISKEIEQAIWNSSMRYDSQSQFAPSSTSRAIGTEAFAFGEVIAKMSRLGFSKTLITATYTSIISHMKPTSFSTSYCLLWGHITRHHIPTVPDLANLVSAFLSHAAASILPKSTVMTTAERNIAARSFSSTYNVFSSFTSQFDVSNEIKQRIRTVARALAGILGVGDTTRELRLLDDDDESSIDKVSEFLERQLLTGGKTGADSVVVARVVICCLAMVYADQSLDAVESEIATEQAHRTHLRILERLISIWMDPTFVKHTSWNRQIYITSAILVLVGYLPPNVLRETVVTAQVMRGVQRWLESAEEAVRKLGMVLAETFSELTDPEGNQLNFNLLDVEADADLLRLKDLARAKDGMGDLNDGEDIQDGESAMDKPHDSVLEAPQMNDDLESDSKERDEDGDEEQDPDEPVEIRKKGDFDNEDEEDISEEGETDSESDLEPYPMEESDDEDTNRRPITRRFKSAKIGRPVYIRDLIAYLREQEDPEKIDTGLSSAEALIRQKDGIGTEVDENAIELARVLLCLENTYELEGFNDRRQRAMVALAMASPSDVVQYLINQFYEKNYSLGQRFTILTVLAIAARELAGTSDNRAPLKPIMTSFPIPPPTSIDTLTTAIQNSLTLSSTEPDSLTAVRIEKTRVFSNKSRIDNSRAKPKSNRFGPLAGSVFFFPLLQGWWEGTRGGWSDRSYVAVATEPILLEKYVMTCGVFLYCATNTPEVVRMAREFWDFALSLRYHRAAHESNVIAAIFFGLQIVLTMSVQPDRRLMDEFGRELAETREWVVGLLETSQDTRVRVGVARVVVRLKELMEIYENELWNQTDRF